MKTVMWKREETSSLLLCGMNMQKLRKADYDALLEMLSNN